MTPDEWLLDETRAWIARASADLRGADEGGIGLGGEAEGEELRAFEKPLPRGPAIAPAHFAPVGQRGAAEVPVQTVRTRDVDAGEFLAANLARHVLHQRLHAPVLIPEERTPGFEQRLAHEYMVHVMAHPQGTHKQATGRVRQRDQARRLAREATPPRFFQGPCALPLHFQLALADLGRTFQRFEVRLR